MTTNPTILTDPARELAELCQKLHNPGDATIGHTYLAAQFGVRGWSKDFYQIIFAILDRIELVKSIIIDLDLDTDVKSEALSHAEDLAGAFVSAPLQAYWNQGGSKNLAPVNVQPIKMLSSMVRQRMSYPKLSPEDVEELRVDVNTLLEWLREHQLSEQDFIRQALIEGLEQFMFRFDKLEWFGYGYAVASLRDIVSAYMALERSVTEPAAHPDAVAMMQKTAAVVRKIYNKVNVAKGVFEAGDFVLKAYGAASLAMTTYPGIAGLLQSS